MHGTMNLKEAVHVSLIFCLTSCNLVLCFTAIRSVCCDVVLCFVTCCNLVLYFAAEYVIYFGSVFSLVQFNVL